MEEIIMNISFIIPCYNEEEHVVSCIDSIKNSIKESKKIQKYEIIVVDNNCTDKTAELAKKQNVIVVSESRKGVVFARQKGFELSNYEFVANIDADSKIPSDWIDTAIKNIQKPNVIAVTGPIVYEDVNIILDYLIKLYYFLANLSIRIIGVFLQGGNCLIEKKYLKILNGYDTSIEFYGEDTMTAKRLQQFGKIKYISELFIFSSARRLKNQGVFKTTWLYVANYFAITFFNRSMTKKYKDYR